MPGARSGDEPHYLVMLFSIIKDGDLIVGNNYDSPDLARGAYLSGLTIDHHSYFVHRTTKEIIPWEKVYEMKADSSSSAEKSGRAESQNIRYQISLRNDHKDFRPADYDETALHPHGYPMLLAPFLYYFIKNDSPNFESIIALLQTALYAFALLRMLNMFQRKRGRPGILTAALMAMALPCWYYNLSFYPEGPASSLMILAFVSFIRKERRVLSLLLGLLLFIKEIYGPVCALYFIADVYFYREWKKSLRLLVFPALAFLFFLIKSWMLFGQIRTYIPFEINPDPIGAWKALWISADSGMLSYTPALILMLAACLIYQRSDRRVLLPAILLLAHLLIAVFHTSWSGGPTYGARPMVSNFGPLLVGYLLWKKSELKGCITRVFWAAPALVFWSISLLNGFYAATHLKTAYFSRPVVDLFGTTEPFWK